MFRVHPIQLRRATEAPIMTLFRSWEAESSVLVVMAAIILRSYREPGAARSARWPRLAEAAGVRAFLSFLPSGLCGWCGVVRKCRTTFWNSGFFVGSDFAMSDLFKSPRRMLGRAKHHIADLEAQINSFIKDKPWTALIETDVDGVGQVFKIRFTERLAEDLPNIVFDCANNLRSALDQMAYAIGIRHTGIPNPKSAKFPFGPTEADMLNDKAGRCKDLPAEISSLFAAFQPYKGGNNAIWALNELCNTPKHKMLYPLAMGAGIGMGGNASVNTIVELVPWTVGWNSEKNELILVRIRDPSGIKGQLNFNGTVTVALDDVDQVIRGQHPVKVLRAMIGEVERVLVTTERECRRIGLIT
jgi:hypothetical protein